MLLLIKKKKKKPCQPHIQIVAVTLGSFGSFLYALQYVSYVLSIPVNLSVSRHGDRWWKPCRICFFKKGKHSSFFPLHLCFLPFFLLSFSFFFIKHEWMIFQVFIDINRSEHKAVCQLLFKCSADLLYSCVWHHPKNLWFIPFS